MPSESGNHGGAGIRTQETLARPTVFKTAPFDRSGTPPGQPSLDAGYGSASNRSTTALPRDEWLAPADVLPPTTRTPSAKGTARA